MYPLNQKPKWKMVGILNSMADEVKFIKSETIYNVLTPPRTLQNIMCIYNLAYSSRVTDILAKPAAFTLIEAWF